MREEQVIDDTTVCVAFLGNFQANAGSSGVAPPTGSPSSK